MDAAHIMEAAAKIIDPGQHPMTTGKMPMLVSSSGNGRIRDGKYKEEQPSHVILRVQDIKEKIDAAQRTTSRLAEASEKSRSANAPKYLKGHSLGKSWNGLETSLFRASSDKEEASSISRNRGKSVSLAVQAKVNVQKRGGTSLSERSIVSPMDTGESKLGESFRSQSRVNNSQHKRTPISNSSGVLRQNNQKQNSTVDMEKTTFGVFDSQSAR
ncbi:hypothetical protein MLD38_017967 [Melastoma candidum]|uniref:Uncharacterized protein n=1 Tax=Melastoma candidum TaxID=119954 RepID=A0ACB9QSJ2_9MYRT|nr:hypothetical protein MLD38_017967 [Melastoma candidum]